MAKAHFILFSGQGKDVKLTEEELKRLAEEFEKAKKSLLGTGIPAKA